MDLHLCLPVTVKGKDVVYQIDMGEYRLVCIESPNSVYVRIDPVVDNASSFTSYPCEISTSVLHHICRCIAIIFKLRQTLSFVCLTVSLELYNIFQLNCIILLTVLSNNFILNWITIKRVLIQCFTPMRYCFS